MTKGIARHEHSRMARQTTDIEKQVSGILVLTPAESKRLIARAVVAMPQVKKALQNVYFDTAASPFLYQPRIYSLASELVGADKILFGSDYPLLPQGRLLQEINSAELAEEEKDLILSGNAKRLLKL